MRIVTEDNLSEKEIEIRDKIWKIIADIVEQEPEVYDRKMRGSLVNEAIALIFWTTPVAAETYTVKMGSDTGELKFVPETLEIKSGDTVQWVNNKVPPPQCCF